MEGPSLFLAAEQLAPFIDQKIVKVSGNTKIGKERLKGCKILNIFSWGKHLVFQFEDFAMRIHFLMFGSFQATIRKKSITGDYRKKGRKVRLKINTKIGHIDFFSCSIKYIESPNAIENYDYSTDIMSPLWEKKLVLKKLNSNPKREIADVLLDQSNFSGVGNIIKNEVLFLAKIHPETKVKEISKNKRAKLVEITREYVFQFYKWRKKFVLRKHYKIYRQSLCPVCKNKVKRQKTGSYQRLSFYCPHCQK